MCVCTAKTVPFLAVVQRWQLFHPPAGSKMNAEQLVDVSHAVIGPLPPNTEISSRIFSADTAEAAQWCPDYTFYTDESGWFMRQRNFDPRKEKNSLTNLAANIVPLYGAALARRSVDTQLSIITAHSHGWGASNRHPCNAACALSAAWLDGCCRRCSGGRGREAVLEIFLARNPPGDDNSTITSHFQWSLDRPETAEAARAASTLALQQPLRPMFGAASSPSAWLATHLSTFAPLGATALPPGVHILNFDGWNGTHTLLRLQHLREVQSPGGIPAVPAGAATVDVGAMLRGFGQLGAWEERTLNVVHPRAAKEQARLVWGGPRDEQQSTSGFVGSGAEALVVTLLPLELRTFLLELHR